MEEEDEWSPETKLWPFVAPLCTHITPNWAISLLASCLWNTSSLHTIPTKPWPLNGANHPFGAFTGSGKRYNKNHTCYPSRKYSVQGESVLEQQSISGKIVSFLLCVWKLGYVKSSHRCLKLEVQELYLNNVEHNDRGLRIGFFSGILNRHTFIHAWIYFGNNKTILASFLGHNDDEICFNISIKKAKNYMKPYNFQCYVLTLAFFSYH